MKVKLSQHENLLYLLIDLIALNLTFFLGYSLRFGDLSALLTSEYLTIFTFINFAWLLIIRIQNYQLENRRLNSWAVFGNFLKVLLLNLILTLAFTSVVKGAYSSEFILKYYALFLITGGMGRILFHRYLKYYRRQGYNFRRIIVLGVNSFSVEFVNEVIQHQEYGYKFLGFFQHHDEDEKSDFKAQEFDKIYNFILDYEIDEVYISLPSNPDYNIKSLIKFCHLNYVKVNFLNEFIHLLNRKTIQVNLDYNGPTPIVSVVKEPLEISFNNMLKRGFDIVFSLGVILFIFSWLFPIIALAIKLNSRGPVFFVQQRTGMNNHSFQCMKFRTMYVNKESHIKQAERNDPRITKVGAFLRKTNLDELPQFINVLKGEMSVVGPRPHMLEHTRMYAKLIEPFMVRHWVKPGITGLAQVKGFRGETKQVRQMYQRIKMDVFYIQNWKFSFDLSIIWHTVSNMVHNRHNGEL